MRGFLGRHLTTVAVAMATAAVTAGGPVAARAIAQAIDADTVDGKDAVGAATSPAKRAGKLVATNSQGRLPNNIIAKAPAAVLADRAKTADKAASATSAETANRARKVVAVDALLGRPCRADGQTGAIGLSYARGRVSPVVTMTCDGVTTSDQNEPNDNTRETATEGSFFGGSSGTIAPVGDVDWHYFTCSGDQAANNLVVSLVSHSGGPTNAVFDGYVGGSTDPSVTNQTSWNIGTVASGQSIYLRVHSDGIADYRPVFRGELCFF